MIQELEHLTKILDKTFHDLDSTSGCILISDCTM